MQAVARQPTIMYFYANYAGFTSIFFYQGGIYNNPGCPTNSINHAVLLVG